MSSGVANQVRIPCQQASQRHLLQYLFIYAAVYAFFLSCFSVCAYIYGLRRTVWIVPHFCIVPQCSLRPTLSLVTFSVLPFVPEVPRSCRQLQEQLAQGRQTVWQKCCNVEQGAREGRESQPTKKAKEVGSRRLQEDQFLRRAHACHGIRGSGYRLCSCPSQCSCSCPRESA